MLINGSMKTGQILALEDESGYLKFFAPEGTCGNLAAIV